MATLVLAAAGGAAGSAVGGSVLGLGAATLGRAVGATLGRAIDQRLLGTGSQVVETGRVERLRLNGASEGAPLPMVFGRTRVAGQVIWASRFTEEVVSTTSGGSGKGLGAPSTPKTTTTTYTYRVSLALALCEGPISHIVRIWADGEELARDDLSYRVYEGTETQQPDPKISAIEGASRTPAYRGTAYVVFEDLDVTQFGNRVPQFSFEIVRPKPDEVQTGLKEMRDLVRAVAMIPGTGEYALADKPVFYNSGYGRSGGANFNAPGLTPDLELSLNDLRSDLPRCKSTSLVVSWFGDDLRCGSCDLQPRIEQNDVDGDPIPWEVAGWTRSTAALVPQLNSRPVYGGTPSDASVVQAIKALHSKGQEVLFYPFILMDQLAGNGLPDPWTGDSSQSPLPWRGRITLSSAPGQPGSPDGSAAAVSQVRSFFGSASPSDFQIVGDRVVYSGPNERSMRRFILHYAALCKAAGGVEAFCIGSEMRALTQIRGPQNSFPAVEEFIGLLEDVRAILGSSAKLSYAADWSEYFGYTPTGGSGEHFFHLDPLWAHPACDFIGIDNYMRISDWRNGAEHRDAKRARSIYDLDYLTENVAGGEGYDWYYADDQGALEQNRLPITDGAHGEPWIYRYKDLKAWWQNAHHDRPGGVRKNAPTAWKPESKPIWFTEYGCAALDKATNQPNKFLDPKSSESRLPRASNGLRDDFVQLQYLRATEAHWGNSECNPVSSKYDGRMVDMARAHVWAWDARPYPYFPARADVWSDGDNYDRGHWLNGRASSRSLSSVVAEICTASGLTDYNVSELYGIVRGLDAHFEGGARSVLQSLMTVYGFDSFEKHGVLHFRSRTGRVDHELAPEHFARIDGQPAGMEIQRAPEHENADRIRLAYREADGEFAVKNSEAALPDSKALSVSQSETALVMTASESRQVTERWLSESRIARETARFALGPSQAMVSPGDVVRIQPDGGQTELFRVDRVASDGILLVEATRSEGSVYEAAGGVAAPSRIAPALTPGPVYPVLMDLPLLPGATEETGAWMAATADPWPGQVAVYADASGAGYRLAGGLSSAAAIGETLDELPAAMPGLIDRSAPVRVKITGGALSSVERAALLAGANAMAIRNGDSDWEVFQFERAELVGPDTYAVSRRLRGQLGTDAIMPPSWPKGSLVVLLGNGIEPIPPKLLSRESPSKLLIGPARYSYDSPLYVERDFVYEAVSLRPYAPVHLRSKKRADGSLELSWVRRTRTDGDLWNLNDVPLGEAREMYLLRFSRAGAVFREETVFEPSWSASLTMQDSLGLTGGSYSVEIAQVSERFGHGPFRRITIDD